MAITSRWFNGLSAEEKDRFRKELKSSISVLERLSAILADDMTRSQYEAMNEENFKLPSWSEYQAYKLGEQASIRKLIEFIDIKE